MCNDVELDSKRQYTLAMWEQADKVKRSKKVDVPTEQWQKSVERRLQILEEKLSVFHLHDKETDTTTVAIVEPDAGVDPEMVKMMNEMNHKRMVDLKKGDK